MLCLKDRIEFLVLWNTLEPALPYLCSPLDQEVTVLYVHTGYQHKLVTNLHPFMQESLHGHSVKYANLTRNDHQHHHTNLQTTPL